VRLAACHAHGDPAQPLAARDDPDRGPGRLDDRTLLDVELEVGGEPASADPLGSGHPQPAELLAERRAVDGALPERLLAGQHAGEHA
jgi:hypothetical protein